MAYIQCCQNSPYTQLVCLLHFLLTALLPPIKPMWIKFDKAVHQICTLNMQHEHKAALVPINCNESCTRPLFFHTANNCGLQTFKCIGILTSRKQQAQQKVENAIENVLCAKLQIFTEDCRHHLPSSLPSPQVFYFQHCTQQLGSFMQGLHSSMLALHTHT